MVGIYPSWKNRPELVGLNLHNSLWEGRLGRLLNIFDDYDFAGLTIVTDAYMPTFRTMLLEGLKETGVLPEIISLEKV